MITAEYLLEVNRQAAGKLQVAASIMGYAHHKSVLTLFKKYGLKWESCRHFEYQGSIDTFFGHCRRLGISEHAARVMRGRKRWTHVQTLDYYTTRQQKKS